LTFGEAATVTACKPFPEGVDVTKVQLLFGAVVDCFAVMAPVTSTHCVSELVTTESVSAAPCFAYNVPLTTTVPAVPLKVADITEDARAGPAMRPPATTAATVEPMRTAERR